MKLYVGTRLDKDVIEYVDELAKKRKWSRSQALNECIQYLREKNIQVA